MSGYAFVAVITIIYITLAWRLEFAACDEQVRREDLASQEDPFNTTMDTTISEPSMQKPSTSYSGLVDVEDITRNMETQQTICILDTMNSAQTGTPLTLDDGIGDFQTDLRRDKSSGLAGNCTSLLFSTSTVVESNGKEIINQDLSTSHQLNTKSYEHITFEDKTTPDSRRNFEDKDLVTTQSVGEESSEEMNVDDSSSTVETNTFGEESSEEMNVDDSNSTVKKSSFGEGSSEEMKADNSSSTVEASTSPGGNDSDSVSESGIMIVAAPQLKHVYVVIGVLGMLANTVVISSLLNEKKLLKSLTNQLILNQSCIDLLASSLVWTVHVFYDHLQVPAGLPRLIFCKLWLSRFLMWGMFQASTHNLVVLTLERYLAIVHPMFHRNIEKPLLGKIFFCLVWLTGPLSDGIFNVSAAYITPDGNCALYSLWGGALLQKIRGCLTFVGNFLLPFLIILFCHIGILYVLRKTQRNQAETSTENRDVRMSRAFRNVIRTLFLVSTCFVICWAFNQILFFSFNLGLKVDFSGAFYHFTVILAFSNCSINPFIYSLNYRPVKRAARKMLFGRCRSSMTSISGDLQMTSSSRGDDLSISNTAASALP